MDYIKLDQSSIDAIAYKAAKIVVSEMKKGEQTPTDGACQ